MMKSILLTAGGVAALSLLLIALPSRSASVQEQDDAAAKLQQKLEKALRDAEKAQGKDYDQLLGKLAQERTLAETERAIQKYESALQNLNKLQNRGEVSEKLREMIEESKSSELMEQLERARTLDQYESALQDLQGVYVDDSDQTVSVLDDEEGPSWLGVETREVTAENMKELKLQAERGVIVDHVTEDSPAAKAGLKEKDVITEVNGQRVEGAAQFRRMIHEIPAGRTTQITVWRDGRAQTLSVTLGKAEENHRAWLKAAPNAFAFAMPKVEIPQMPSFDLNGDVLMFPGGGARLGIDAEDISGQLGAYFGAPDGEGILVRSVNSGSPAEKAGLKAGDVITKFDGDRIRTVGDLREKLSANPDEKQPKLGVLRNKSEVTVTVELPERGARVKHKIITKRTYI